MREKVERQFIEKKGYRKSPKDHIYKSYGAFRISLSFSTSNRLLCLIIYSIDPGDFTRDRDRVEYIRRGRIIETLEALQQDIGALKRKVFPKSKKFVRVVNIMYSDLSNLWEKV